MKAFSGEFYEGEEFKLQKNGSINGSQQGAAMDASRCSTIYGNSSTVTPLSESCRFYIRY